MYSLQYWNEGAAEWRGTGTVSRDIEIIRSKRANMSRQCQNCVRFRILTIPV